MKRVYSKILFCLFPILSCMIGFFSCMQKNEEVKTLQFDLIPVKNIKAVSLDTEAEVKWSYEGSNADSVKVVLQSTVEPNPPERRDSATVPASQKVVRISLLEHKAYYSVLVYSQKNGKEIFSGSSHLGIGSPSDPARVRAHRYQIDNTDRLNPKVQLIFSLEEKDNKNENMVTVEYTPVNESKEIFKEKVANIPFRNGQYYIDLPKIKIHSDNFEKDIPIVFWVQNAQGITIPQISNTIDIVGTTSFRIPVKGKAGENWLTNNLEYVKTVGYSSSHMGDGSVLRSVIDDNTETHWHTPYGDTGDFTVYVYPHFYFFQIVDLPAEIISIDTIRYFRRSGFSDGATAIKIHVASETYLSATTTYTFKEAEDKKNSDLNYIIAGQDEVKFFIPDRHVDSPNYKGGVDQKGVRLGFRTIQIAGNSKLNVDPQIAVNVIAVKFDIPLGMKTVGLELSEGSYEYGHVGGIQFSVSTLTPRIRVKKQGNLKIKRY